MELKCWLDSRWSSIHSLMARPWIRHWDSDKWFSGISHTNENINNHLNGIIIYLEKKINDILGEHSELISIRDDLLSELEQFKYLLTFI